MCGIFGVLVGNESKVTSAVFQESVEELFKLSESRGKESAGLAILNGGPIQIYKQPVAASVMIRSRAYKNLLRQALAKSAGEPHQSIPKSLSLIGHSRLVTNGAQENNLNNQPVGAAGMVGIHNGIIVNDRELWERFPSMRRGCDVDTEVLLNLIRRFYEETGSLVEAARRSFRIIEGVASVALLFEDLNCLLMATNNGALYSCCNADARLTVFASEEYILRELIRQTRLSSILDWKAIRQCRPGEAHLVRLDDAGMHSFSLLSDEPNEISVERETAREIVDVSEQGESNKRTVIRASNLSSSATGDDVRLLFQDKEYIDLIPRCKKCILPETFPFISFDEQGVCNYCRNYHSDPALGIDSFRRRVAQYKRDDGKPDCLVGVSGGRDSCYGLHLLKHELGMNPIAYTYDWGMVTDIARRNISRMCGKLGIEHILISADIRWKRSNIRKNVRAWLRRPELGMVPLFMAGDKQFFYHADQLKKRTGVDLFVFCAGNRLETTDFKVGFCGVPSANAKGLLRLPKKESFRLASYYGMQFLKNPAYLNSSIWDTLFAYFCSYMMPHDYAYLFHHIPWDEQTIMETLINDYRWELASDTVATWRIGDGTASFYNYIYYTVAGFTEMDTFRSNQIREGVLDRATAMEIVKKENQPRYESLKWYFGVINLDISFNDVIRTINAIPKRYPVGRDK